MERFIKGDVVVVPFPFSDLSRSKRRPAFVVQSLKGPDLLLAEITSKPAKNEFAILLTQKDFTDNSLNKPSNIRTDQLFTCAKNLISYKIGPVRQPKIDQIIQTIKQMLDK